METTVTIYADVLFFINFTLDFMCLYITAKVMCIPLKSFRAVVCGTLGGIYSCLAVFFDVFPTAVTAVIHITVAFLLCLTAFGREKILKRTSVFVLTCAVSGGLLCGAYALTGKLSCYNGGFYVEADPLFVLVFAVIACVASLFYLLIVKKTAGLSAENVVFTLNGRRISARLLADTGAFLRDALSGDPVIIVNARILGKDYSCDITADALTNLGSTARLISVHTVSGSRLLVAYRPETVIIKGRSVSVLVALDGASTDYGGYDGIIPMEILQ